MHAMYVKKPPTNRIPKRIYPSREFPGCYDVTYQPGCQEIAYEEPEFVFTSKPNVEYSLEYEDGHSSPFVPFIDGETLKNEHPSCARVKNLLVRIGRSEECEGFERL